VGEGSKVRKPPPSILIYAPDYGVQDHSRSSRSVPIESPYATSY